MSFQNKKEFLNNSTQSQILAIDSSVSINDLSESGLNVYEKKKVNEWLSGNISGRQCMIAIIDHRRKSNPESNESQVANAARPIDILTTSVSLPCEIFNASVCGRLYEELFKRPPRSVIREALQLLASKAREKSAASLNCEQINIALKQVRIEFLLDLDSRIKSAFETDSRENKPFSDDSSSIDSELRIQVLVELIRIHIEILSESSTVSGADESGCGVDVANDQDSLFSKIKKEFEKSVAENLGRDSSSDSQDIELDVAMISKTLDATVQVVTVDAEKLSMSDLESSNAKFKGYLKQLASLKTSIASQLNDLEESKAYLTLGIPKNSNDSSLKKAYHSMAIKLHPDKGGDTAKFQKLQESYQEILKQRRLDQVSKEAIEKHLLNESTKAGADKACSLINELGSTLKSVKEAADFCTDLAQRGIKFVKKLEKASKSPRVKALNDMMKLVSSKTASERLDFSAWKDAAASHLQPKSKIALNANNCSVLLAVEPCEEVCGGMQALAALAMTLPNCGALYGLAAASRKAFMKLIEESMSMGLSVLQAIGAVVSTDQQIKATVKRLIANQSAMMIERTHFSGDAEYINDVNAIEDVSIELLVTAFASGSTTLSAIADRAVACALLAADIYKEVSVIVASAEKEVYEDAKRKASSEEEDSHFSQEDLDELRRHRRAQYEESLRRGKQQDDAADKTDAGADENKDISNTDSDATVASKAMQDATKTRRDKSSSSIDDELSDLKDKIRQLQIKLRVQNTQVLQTLNSEARDLQKKLQVELVVLAANTSNLDSPLVSAGNGNGNSNSNGKTDHKGAGAGGAGGAGAAVAAVTYRSAIFSLLAECIDGSCHTLRQDLQNSSVGVMTGIDSVSCDIDNSNNINDNKSGVFEPTVKDLNDTLSFVFGAINRNLGWLLDFHSGCSATDSFAYTPLVLDDQPSAPTEDHLNDNANANAADSGSGVESSVIGGGQQSEPIVSDAVQRPFRLALLPDYRSRAMWLAALVEADTVHHIIQSELQLRLSECIQLVVASKQQSLWSALPRGSSSSQSFLRWAASALKSQPASDHEGAEDFAVAISRLFCERVVQGVGVAIAQ